MAPDCRAADENQMIERQAGEGSSNISTAGDNGKLGLVKVTGHQPLHEARCYRRQLREAVSPAFDMVTRRLHAPVNQYDLAGVVDQCLAHALTPGCRARVRRAA